MAYSRASARRSDLADRLFTKPVIVVALTGVVLVAAWNRAEPLIYGLFSLLVAALVIGFSLPALSLRGISGDRTLPARAFEGERIAIVVDLVNRALLPRYMIEIEDSVPAAPPGERAVRGYIARLPAAGREQAGVDFECYKRGVYSLGPVTLRSGFPLGLIEVTRRLADTRRTLVVYPATFPVKRLALPAASRDIAVSLETASRAGGAADFFGVREYRQGDPPRHVHWPSSARHGQLIVKEFELVTAPSLAILLDLGKHSAIGSERHTPLEYAVKIAASVGNWAAGRGIEVQLIGHGAAMHWTQPGHGSTMYADLLETLARVEADGEMSYADALIRSLPMLRTESAAIIFLSYPGRLTESLRAVDSLRAAGVEPLVIAFDRGSFESSGDTGQDDPPPLLRDLAARGVWTRRVARGMDLAGVFDP